MKMFPLLWLCCQPTHLLWVTHPFIPSLCFAANSFQCTQVKNPIRFPSLCFAALQCARWDTQPSVSTLYFAASSFPCSEVTQPYIPSLALWSRIEKKHSKNNHLMIQFLTSKVVSEVNEQGGASKWVSSASKRTSEWTNKCPSTYIWILDSSGP